jgi:hypothetical protein
LPKAASRFVVPHGFTLSTGGVLAILSGAVRIPAG